MMLRFRNLIHLASILIVVLVLSCSDKVKEIINPEFELNASFTLSDRVYSVGDMVKRQSQISIDSSTNDLLLKFSTDEIRKDTTLSSFVADVFIGLHQDTTVNITSTNTINVEMIIRRDSIRIDEAEIESGEIFYEITNYSNKSSSFQFLMPGFTKNIGGQIDTFKLEGELNPGATITKSSSLGGFSYKQPPNQPFGTTRPGFWVKGFVNIQGGSPGDSAKILTNVTDIVFKRIKGRFKPISLARKEQSFANSLSKDLTELIQNVTFDSINVILKGKTSIKGFPIMLKDLRILGTYNSGAPPISVLFKRNGSFVSSFDTTFQPNTTTYFNFNNVNTNINTFLALSPDKINISAELVLNPTYVSGEVNANDSISFSFIADAWSKMSIDNSTFTDTFAIEIKPPETRDKFLRGGSGSITLEIENRIPLSVKLIGLVTDSFYNPLLYITKNISNDSVLSVNGASVNSDGRVILPNYTTLQKNLTDEEIKKFKDAYFLIQRFVLSSTDNRIVYVSANDEVKIRASGSIKVKLLSDDFE